MTPEELLREARAWRLHLDRMPRNPMLRRSRREIEQRIARLQRKAATCQRCGREFPVVASPCPTCKEAA